MPICFPDNVFFLGDKLSGLIDFYFACTDTLAYDVAICLNAWCFEPDHSYNVTKGRALLDAYRARPSAAPQEMDALPLLARGAALRFLLTRLVDWLDVPPGALVRPKDPLEYVAQAALPPAGDSVRAIYGSGDVERRTSRSGPTAPAPAIPAPAAGARSSPSATTRRRSRAARRATTNNRMELMAAIAALRSAETRLHGRSPHRQPVSAQRHHHLDRRLEEATAGAPPTRSRSRTSNCGSGSNKRPRATRFVGTGCKGHAGHPMNERADELAREGMQPFLRR